MLTCINGNSLSFSPFFMLCSNSTISKACSSLKGFAHLLFHPLLLPGFLRLSWDRGNAFPSGTSSNKDFKKKRKKSSSLLAGCFEIGVNLKFPGQILTQADIYTIESKIHIMNTRMSSDED